MYSEKIIIQNLDKFAAREGWMPTPHTFAQVEEFKHYIDSIVKIESNSRSSYISLVRPITEKRRKEIWRWIENEQVMCGLDSGYFDECYAYVCNEGGEIFKFKNRKSQEVFDSVIADFDEQQVAIRLLILKARQVGITTKTALKFLQRMLFIPHTQAVMASVQSDKSELIGRILDIAYNQCPWWLVPRRLPKGAFDNGSVLSIQSGMQATGIAQGWTPTCLAPDTRIRLADGALKRVDTLTDNDVILTHKNIVAHVKKAWKTERTNEPTKIIWVAGVDMPLECTFDHAIYTATGWMQAQDLCAGQLMTRMDDEGKIVDTVITHIEEGFQKEFWDVEVDHADHSFQTEQCAAHNCIHVCLAPDTLIHVGNGRVKCIVEVVPGDLIITSKGRQAEVKAVAQSPRTNEAACEIALWGNYSPLTVTRDHPILTPEGFKPAEEIGKGDFVRMPVRPITRKKKDVQIEWTPKGRKSKKVDKKAAYQNFKLDYGFGWLCGLYLSEGSIHFNTRLADKPADGVYFSIHQKEQERVALGIQRVLGMFQHLRYSECKTSKTATFALHDSGLARWFMENFGKGAEGKEIPDWVFTAGENFVDGLLCGYCEGDGHLATDLATVSCTSISFALLLQVRDLMASRGYGWGSLYFKPAGVHYGRTCQDSWNLNLNSVYANKFRAAMGWETFERSDYKLNLSDVRCSHSPKHWRYSENGKFVDIQVFENKASFSDSFFDLEVDAPEHNFCTVHCCVKNSELADIPKPKKVIEEGLLRATHATPNLFMVFEGTGGGNTGWLAETWRAAKEDFPKGLHDLCPVFIPWPMATDLYPEAAWIRQFPVPEGFYQKRMEATRKHVIRAESYIRNTPFLSRIAGKDWRMPLEQQWFWEFNFSKSCKNHSQKIWLAQMPADDFEALTGVHDSVFDVETIQEIEDHIYEVRGSTKERKNPVQAYAITGDSIDDGFEPPEPLIDYDKAHIRVSWKSDRGQRYDWVLVPLLPLDEDVEQETFDKLLVYEEPKRGYTYSCGIDTADGLGKEDEDRTVVSVTRNRFGDEYDYQVAELCLAEGSMVITPNGVKKIEEFVKGDEVIDRLGRTVKVSKTSNSDHGNSLSVWTAFSSSEPLNLTPDHHVSTAEGWKEAQELKVGDWLRYPVRPLVEKSLPEIVLQKCRVSLCGESRNVTLHLDRDLGFACGLYLAEGCVGLSREGVIRHVAFTLHEREAAPWKEIIQRAFPDCHITEQAINQSHAHRLMISLKNVATWVADTFGRKEEKHVPSWVWNAPRDFVEGIVLGMVAGDGSIDKRCASVNYTSVLPSLVISLRELMLSLGWGIGVIRKHPRTIAKDAWSIQFYGEAAEHFFIEDMIRVFPPSTKRRPPQFRWGWNREWIYIKVRKIKESCGGKFYDLTIDGDDPSFCVLQAAVHNCSNRINSAQVVGFAACIAAWYGENSKDSRGVKFCVEQIGRPGDTCQHQLKLMGFHWHHIPRRYDSKKIKDDAGKKQGWFSNVWSVPILMTRFTEAVNGGWYRPASRWLIEELKTLERHAAAGRISKMEHRSGQHDDRVRAAAQSFFTAHDFDILAERSQKRYALPTEKVPPLSKSVCSTNMVSVGGLD